VRSNGRRSKATQATAGWLPRPGRRPARLKMMSKSIKRVHDARHRRNQRDVSTRLNTRTAIGAGATPKTRNDVEPRSPADWGRVHGNAIQWLAGDSTGQRLGGSSQVGITSPAAIGSPPRV